MHSDDTSGAALEDERDENDSSEVGEDRAAARDEEDADRRAAVNAADDTGLVSAQERLHVVEVEDGEQGGPL